MSPAISPQHRPRWKEVDVIRRARWFIVLVCLLVHDLPDAGIVSVSELLPDLGLPPVTRAAPALVGR